MDETGMVGWDFSRLDGRMWSDEPPWDRPDAFDPARLPEGHITLTQRRFCSSPPDDEAPIRGLTHVKALAIPAA